MKQFTAAVSLGLVLSCGQAFGQTCPRPPIGPDVIVGDLTGPQDYTPNSTGFDAGFDALALGTTSCNIGNVGLQWYNNGDTGTFGADIANKHPVIGGNLYRYSIVDGASRFEQVGQSWLKHGFLALSQTLCCSNCDSTDGNTLGVGCSDPYTAGRNGGQTGAGPKYQVNADTGEYPYPIPATAPFSGETARRIRVALPDLVNTTGGTAATTRYFGESQYISPDDAAAGNANNNAAVREIAVSGGTTNKSFTFVGSGPYATTNRQKSAIRVWKEIDPYVVESPVQIPNEGFLILSSRAKQLPSGLFRYEYALYNMNSDRSVGSLTIPVPNSLAVSNVGFRDTDYHSGDGVGNANYDGTNWPWQKKVGSMYWTTDAFSGKPNANAIRWGTTYNFRFDTTVAPSMQSSMAVIGLFKPGMPGDPSHMLATAVVPAEPQSLEELLTFFDLWSAQNGANATTDSARRVNFDGNAIVDLEDLLSYFDHWSAQ